MIPQSTPKKPKNSSKANLIISAVVHGILVALLFYYAAKEGLLGKKLQTITVTMEKKVKPPEPPKPKPEPPKEVPKEVPKIEQPKMAAAPKAAPPAAAPVVAPPPAEISGFEFAGGHDVISENDPVQRYKGYMEYVLRTKWDRPEDMDDDQYVAEVAVAVDKKGNISESRWLKGSGNEKWDQTVRDVFTEVANIGQTPPTNFPPEVTIRFDVQEEEDESLMTQ